MTDPAVPDPAVPTVVQPTVVQPTVIQPTVIREHIRRTRRRNAWYAAAIAGGIVVIVLVVALFRATGEYADTTIRTASGEAPAAPALQTLSPALAVRWQNTDHAAGGSTYWLGTVVTFDEHTVSGRNSLDGTVQWSYERSDDTVCGVQVQDGVAVAVFMKNENCDQAIGLDATTGTTKWIRTLVDSGRTTMQSRGSIVLLVGPDSVHAIDPGGGLDRWMWTVSGCKFRDVVLGDQGVLASLRCNAASPDIAGTGVPASPSASSGSNQTVAGVPGSTLDRDQDRLVLHKLYDDGDTWQQESSVTPVLADRITLVWSDSDKALIQYEPTKGQQLAKVPVSAATTGTTAPTGTVDTSHAFVFIGSQLIAFDTGSGSATPITQRWAVSAAGQPIPLPPNSDSAAGRPLAIPVATGIQDVDAATGALGTVHSSPVPLVPPAFSVRLGSGVVGSAEADGSGTAVLQ